MAALSFPGIAPFGFSRVSRVQAFLAAHRLDGNRLMLLGGSSRPVPHPARLPAVPLRCSLPLQARAGAGDCRVGPPFARRCGIVHRHAFQRLPARRLAARCESPPVSGDADVDPFGNVYFSRRVLTHVRLPLRILSRVLRRFARPRSTARNPRKDAPRL